MDGKATQWCTATALSAEVGGSDSNFQAEIKSLLGICKNSNGRLLSGVVKAGFLTGSCQERPSANDDLESDNTMNKLSRDGLWVPYFFVLLTLRKCKNTNELDSWLVRFTSPESGQPLDHIDLNEAKVNWIDCKIHIKTRDCLWVLSCFSNLDSTEWADCLQDAHEGRLQAYQPEIVQNYLKNIHKYFLSRTCKYEEEKYLESAPSPKHACPESQCKKKPSHDDEEIIENGPQFEFRSLLRSNTASYEIFQKRLASDPMRRSTIRSVLWRRMIGLLGESVETWREITQLLRQDYNHLVNKHIMTHEMFTETVHSLEKKLLGLQIHGSSGNKDMDGSGNEISKTGNAVEQVTIEDELRKLRGTFNATREIEWQISKDIERTKVGSVYLNREYKSICSMILRIMLVWAKANQKVGYKQGMCEIIGVVVYVLHSDYSSLTADHSDSKQGCDGIDLDGDHMGNSTESLLHLLMNCRYLEHDAYMIFDRLLLPLIPVYDPGSNDDDMGFHSSVNELNETMARSIALPSRLENIQHRLLKHADPLLAAHLRKLGVEPHMYLLRWMRVLFAREIMMPDLALVWDSIISITPHDFKMIDSVCVALLTESRIRTRLMQSPDASDALLAIKKIPRFSEADVTRLIRFAVKVHTEYEELALTTPANFEKQKIETVTNQMGLLNGQGVPLTVTTSDDTEKKGYTESYICGNDWVKINMD